MKIKNKIALCFAIVDAVCGTLILLNTLTIKSKSFGDISWAFILYAFAVYFFIECVETKKQRLKRECDARIKELENRHDLLWDNDEEEHWYDEDEDD